MSTQVTSPAGTPHLIEVKVAEVHQLFNSMDPSPFHERDLDHDAEQFILSWAQEFPSRAPLKLVVHLGKAPEAVADPAELITKSIHHYFTYRHDMARREFRLLMKEGRTALIIGLAFLIVCELAARSLPATQDTWHGTVRQGLTIIGWVAMWKPLEIYLYRWWPLRRLQRVLGKLSTMPVEVRQSGCD